MKKLELNFSKKYIAIFGLLLIVLLAIIFLIGNTYGYYQENLELKDFYNTIVDLFETYAYEMDTEIDNIHIDIVEIEIVKGDKNENQVI